MESYVAETQLHLDFTDKAQNPFQHFSEYFYTISISETLSFSLAILLFFF